MYLSFGLNSRQLQFLGQHVGQFVQRNFDFANVTTGLVPSLSLSILRIARLAHGLADFAFPLSDAAGPAGAVFEPRDFDVGDRDADDFASLSADHFAIGDVLPQIFSNLPADDFTESLEVAMNITGHG